MGGGESGLALGGGTGLFYCGFVCRLGVGMGLGMGVGLFGLVDCSGGGLMNPCAGGMFSSA